MLHDSHPQMIVNEDAHAFTECATFADDIKDTFGAYQYGWHFIDQPYLDEQGTSIDDFDFSQPTEDVVHALTDFTLFMKGEKDKTNSIYIGRIA